MIVWAVIAIWSLLAGVVCGGVIFGARRNEGGEMPIARAEAWAAGAAGMLITSVILVICAGAAGLLS